VELHRSGKLAEAERLYLQLAAAEPEGFTPRYLLGILRSQQKRYGEALALIGAALRANPGVAEAWLNHGILLRTTGRWEEALDSFERALAIRPGDAGALKQKGETLRQLNRHAQAVACFDRLLTHRPGDIEAWNDRGLSLQALQRFDEAVESYDKVLAIRPDFAEVLSNRGKALLESGRIDDAFAAFGRAAVLTYGGPAAPAADAPAHQLRHDREQAAYLGCAADGRLRIEGGARLAGPAVAGADAGRIARQWQTASPQMVVIDDLLTPQALEGLRRFCWGSTVWRKPYDGGYLGAFPQTGFACPLIAQIAEELRTVFPAIFEAHPLRYCWAFKYDSRLSGINIHADEAAVNVNFWITPDEANLDPEHGGLVVWDKAAPLDWDFARFNGDIAATRDFLARSGASKLTVPYRANRAVVFDSDLFHETDRIGFRDGYRDRRINVTLLYGRREPG
jgi:Flp pilus assembly protein TadD